MSTSPESEIERYLLTGEHDERYSGWPGDDFLARAKRGDASLREALLSVVDQRTADAVKPVELAGLDVAGCARRKVAPMVHGLFPAAERAAVLDVLARSVVFLTRDTVFEVIERAPRLSTAWNLANLYLASCGAERLCPDAPPIVGLSEDTTCYVSTEYFRSAGRFEDFVVHEAAHIFHNCKRWTIGLREVRGREWLLPIEFRKRETFAYACEAYSRILEHTTTLQGRRQLLEELGRGPIPPDDRVDSVEYLAILRQAVEARNGWKRLLESCVDRPVRRRHPHKPEMAADRRVLGADESDCG